MKAKYVKNLNPKDVLFGRGSGANEHEGNIIFRELVAERKEEYLATNHRMTKSSIAREIVRTIISNRGRFLKKLEDSELKKLGLPKNKELYALVDDEIAIVEKTKQALRQNREKPNESTSATTTKPSKTKEASVSNSTRCTPTKKPSKKAGVISTSNRSTVMEPKERLAIGVDVGGTHMMAIVVDTKGKIRHRVREDVEASERGDVDGILKKILKTIVQAISCCGSDDASCELVGLGLGIPGNVDPIKGNTRYLPNYGWNEEVPLASNILRALRSSSIAPWTDSEQGKALLRNLDKHRIEMRNDGRCAALAERHFGIGKDYKPRVFAMLTLGTGIGGAVCFGEKGVLFEGSSFDAGDFGHHVICSGGDAFDCVCGKRGCFEVQASAAGLVRHFRRELKRVNRVKEADKASLDDAKSVVELMRSGDEVAVKAWKSFQEDLATGLANVVTFYNPDVICLGGGIAQAKELYLFDDGKSIGDAVDAKTLPATRGTCRICPSMLGGDMVALGAAQLALAAQI